ncbi:unnamed protein product [Mytilus edulis]|uniref:SGNH hydrolase-type esterase domain-containing protein n=2 Tax=Mytilus TaxID=6548 RepID=A0A8B6CN29_MYTGA|nr:unnamed protein product [Mytilus edulis]VDI07358.1 Hypothetical predicted protein [Mytilus galloprovincialis]
MSETKLVKFLQTARKPLAGTQQLTPAILSDSKGSYLRDQVVNKSDRNIIWWCKGGATIDDRYHWLKSNIVKKIEQLGNISVYIFLGTCNLTSKNKTGEITLTSQQEHFTDEIISKLGQFVTLFKKYPSSKLTILEIPVYSITEWNRYKGHKNPETFKDQDSQLQKQIENINEWIHTTNQELGSRSPLLNHHLRARKQQARGKHKPCKKYYNVKLYKDGIHPKQLLAKAWLAEIVEQVHKDCWA